MPPCWAVFVWSPEATPVWDSQWPEPWQSGKRAFGCCVATENAGQAVQQIIAETGNTDVHLGLVDVSSLESVRSFCNRFEGDRVDVLIHNAGILPPERLDTEDGLESTLATHLVGPYLMTQLLLPLLAKGDRARVIWVSSGGMYTQRLNTGELENPPEPFDGVLAYARAKRGTVTLNRLWAKTLLEHGIASPRHASRMGRHTGSKNPSPDFGKSPKKILRTLKKAPTPRSGSTTCDKAQATAGLFWFDRKARSEFFTSENESVVGRRRKVLTGA